ncbi:MAG: hypothetical protein HY298_06500 [Verrucomicrobia bacterium]|nr:hypothetical protein [Verrucomicrobiota bacterium]
MRKIFYVDQAMCGGEELPAEFDLEEFCEVLQGKVPEVEIVPVIDSEESAVNRDPSLVPESVLNEALGEYCHR